ncbi:hypothetical protein [uncultured Kriegella sp.]|uniref:hypothetical protein n=1 Tax=uncultured Kriegella sp. TaxID=1798910 RepID=UPI0030DA1F7C|tara:strand:- start:193877 stop:194200 length:324 start_codon:yes stop_codon:yes gene_type:complete
MELELFIDIRNTFCETDPEVTEGKMMSSPAIHYKNKVFAFFSRRNTMVFKLGKNYPLQELDVPLHEFNPFKKRGPLLGWYEVKYTDHHKWMALTSKALELIKFEQKI